MNTIPFTEKDVKEYLDNCIIKWRKRKRKHQNESYRTSKELELMAADYIDAYQSVRMSLFGEVLE